MNGVDLARRLRAQLPAIPIILTSGAERELGLGLFIAKPYELDEAIGAVFDTLRLDRSRL